MLDRRCSLRCAERRGSGLLAKRWARQPGLGSHRGARAKARQEKHGASPTKGSAGLDAGERGASRGRGALVRWRRHGRPRSWVCAAIRRGLGVVAGDDMGKRGRERWVRK